MNKFEQIRISSIYFIHFVHAVWGGASRRAGRHVIRRMAACLTLVEGNTVTLLDPHA
jgi:hypothetical protein